MEFQILNGRNNAKELLNHYNQAYATFKQTWSDEFSALRGENVQISSNDFTRQDWMISLFKDDTCVAIDCMREMSIQSAVQTDDSWFQPWEKKHFEQFAKDGYDRAIVNSYFTVHKDHRRTVEGGQINTAFLAGCLSVLYQVELGCPLMVGMMRNNRSMNTLGNLWGGRAIDTVMHNGIPTDIFVFETEGILKASKNFPKYVFEIFNKNQTIKKGPQRHERIA